MPSTLRSLFAYKAWSNAELFALLAQLPERAAPALPGCLRTLNHIYHVDRIFRAHLAGEARPFDATNAASMPALADLRADVAETDAWYIGYAERTPASALVEPLKFEFTDGDAGRMSREEMLVHVPMHVLMHGGYHRGNVGQMLREVSVNPPRDLYTRFLHASEPARRA